MTTAHTTTLAEDMLTRLVAVFNEALDTGESANAVARAVTDTVNEMDERERTAHTYVLPCLLSPGDRLALMVAVVKTCESRLMTVTGGQAILQQLCEVPTPEFLADTAALVAEAEGS